MGVVIGSMLFDQWQDCLSLVLKKKVVFTCAMKKPIFFLLMSLLLMGTSSALPLMRDQVETEDERASGAQITNEARRDEEVVNSSGEEQFNEPGENQSSRPRENIDSSVINTLSEAMQRDIRTTTKLKAATELLKEKKEAAEEFNQAYRKIDPDALSVITLDTPLLGRITRGAAKLRAGAQALSAVQQQNRKRNKKRLSKIREQVAPFIENTSEENQETDQQIENELSQRTADLEIDEAASSQEGNLTRIAENFQNKIQQTQDDLSNAEAEATSSLNQAEADRTPDSWELAKQAVQKTKSAVVLLKTLCELIPDHNPEELERVAAQYQLWEQKENDVTAKLEALQNAIIAHSNYMSANAQKIRDEIIPTTKRDRDSADQRGRQPGYYQGAVTSYDMALTYWNESQEAQKKNLKTSANLLILASTEALAAASKWKSAVRSYKPGPYNRKTYEEPLTDAAYEKLRRARKFADQAKEN